MRRYAPTRDSWRLACTASVPWSTAASQREPLKQQGEPCALQCAAPAPATLLHSQQHSGQGPLCGSVFACCIVLDLMLFQWPLLICSSAVSTKAWFGPFPAWPCRRPINPGLCVQCQCAPQQLLFATSVKIVHFLMESGLQQPCCCVVVAAMHDSQSMIL